VFPRNEFIYAQISGLIALVSIVLFVIYLPFPIPNKPLASCILGVVVYSVVLLFLMPNMELRVKKFFKFGNTSQYLILLICILSILLILLPSAISNSPIFLDWTNFNLLMAGRLIASLLLVSFLSGYALLKIMFYRRPVIFSKIGTVVLSVLLSFGITFLVTFFYWIRNSETRGVGQLLLISYSVLFTAWLSLLLLDRRIGKKKEENKNEQTYPIISSHSVLVALLLSSIAAFMFWAFQVTHFIPNTLPMIGDELGHAQIAGQLLTGWYSWPQMQTMVLNYPYAFHFSLSAVSSLSSIPLGNVLPSFFFVLVLPAFAFYFMTETIFDHDKHVPLIATVIFSVFSGFGWVFYNTQTNSGLVANSIFQASQRTYDIIYSTWFPLYIAPYAVELSILFVLIGLMCHKNLKTSFLFFFIAILTTLGIFSHIEAMLVFSFLLFFLSILQSFSIVKFGIPLKTTLLSYIAGILLFVGLNFLAQYKLSADIVSIILNGIYIAFASLILLQFSELVKRKLHVSIKGKLNSAKIVFPILIFCLYFVLFLVFFYSYPSYIFDGNTVPFWFLPLKFGIAGLLSLIGIFFFYKKPDKEVGLFLAFFAGAVFMELLLFHLPFSIMSVDFQEYRIIRDILWPFLSVIAAFGLVKLLLAFKLHFSPKRRLLKYLVISLLVVVIFASSIPSNLLKVTYFSSSQTATSEQELAGLQHLSTLRIPVGSYLLTGVSLDTVNAVTGAQAISIYDPVYSQLIFNSKSPGTVLYTLQYLNISYIFLSTTDMQYLSSKYSDGYFMWLLPHLTCVFKNNETSIYEFPPLSAPVDDSNTVALTGDLLTYSGALTEAPLWVNDNFSAWRNITQVNIDSCNFAPNGSSLVLEAKTQPQQQAAVFYQKNLEKPMLISNNNTLVVFTFSSETGVSYAILDVLYSDGSSQRISLRDNVYMNSLNQNTVTEYLHSNESVAALRIGLTDNSQGDGTLIGISVQYLAIVEAGEPSHYYESTLLTASMGISYTTISEFDYTRFNFDNIIIPDTALSNESLEQYIEWVNSGGNLIVWVDPQKPGAFSNLLGINAMAKNVTANALDTDISNQTSMPILTIPELKIFNENTSTIASYTMDNHFVSPLILQSDVGQGKILCIEADSLFNSTDTQELSNLMHFISNVLRNIVNLYANPDLNRIFYTKTMGSINSQGSSQIDTSNVIFGLNGLSDVNINSDDTSKKTDAVNMRLPVNNATISQVILSGKPTIQIENFGNVVVLPMDSDTYLLFQITGNTSIQINLTNSSKAQIYLAGNSNQSISAQNGLLTLNFVSENTEFVIKKPTFLNNGTTTFSALYTADLYHPLSNGNSGSFNGAMQFKMVLSEVSVLLLDAQFNGDMTINSNFKPANQDLSFFSSISSATVLPILSVVLVIIVLVVIIESRKKSE